MSSETPAAMANNKSRQYSQSEKKAYIAKWKQSSLTRSEFCRREGLSLQTFCYWVKTYSANMAPKAKPALAFMAVASQTPMPLRTTQAPIEIHLPTGLRCCFDPSVDVQHVLKIVEGLSHVTDD